MKRKKKQESVFARYDMSMLPEEVDVNPSKELPLPPLKKSNLHCEVEILGSEGLVALSLKSVSHY